MTCAASKWQTEDLFTDSSMVKGIDDFPGPVGAPAGGLLATPMGWPQAFPMRKALPCTPWLRPQSSHDAALGEGAGGPDSPRPQAGIWLTWIPSQAGSGSGGVPVLAL